MSAAAVQAERFDPELVRRLGRLDLIAQVVADGVALGVHHSRRRGFSNEFSDFKPYVPGDDLRLLDWRLYARTDRFYVKRFDAETNLEVMLVLDATRSMAWRWDDRVSKLEYAANFLAAMACIHLRQQDLVGLLTHDTGGRQMLPPRAQRVRLDEIFATLAALRPGAEPVLGGLLGDLADGPRHRGLIVVCSDLEEDADSVARGLGALAGRDDELVLFHLLDAAEEDLPFRNVTHLRDSETGELLAVDLATLRREHAETVRTFRAQWRGECERGGVLYLPLHTGMDYVEAMYRYIDARAVQRRG